MNKKINITTTDFIDILQQKHIINKYQNKNKQQQQ